MIYPPDQHPIVTCQFQRACSVYSIQLCQILKAGKLLCDKNIIFS
ncbi:hypothetical protein D1BOALGB6SA_39 [Olavius sp. associated proteobacterium Delta 1]|nr:hypothetical protein D1BOALGB6SA_39 [Olavius sp. associated proteobacterium Delta 1]